jgi:4'-phosphopantetheinyl transferase
MSSSDIVSRSETGTSPDWHRASDFPATPVDDVHVWRARLDLKAADLEQRAALLNDAERTLASRLRFEIDRARYVAARGLLREILGRYLHIPPARLTFQLNPFGKPSLGGEHAAFGLEFSVSHAGDIALYAVSRGRRVGVDVEECTPRLSTAKIAAQFFSRSEADALQALPPSRQTRAFFAAWTRKEAFAKARGEGLHLPFQGFTVEIDPDRPARLIEADRPGELERWSMVTLPIEPPYQAALAAEGSGWTVKLLDAD